MVAINKFLKRLFDIVSSGIAIIILIPLWIIIAIAIKKDSKGPIFFKQGRRTTNGKVFHMYKFRSMIVDAEKMGAGLFNYKDDPRVTKVGKFLRKSSLDELPQLFNIFFGDMSVVGPRPCVTYELGDFESGLMAHWLGTVRAVVVGGCLTMSVVISTFFMSKPLRDFSLEDDKE